MPHRKKMRDAFESFRSRNADVSEAVSRLQEEGFRVKNLSRAASTYNLLLVNSQSGEAALIKYGGEANASFSRGKLKDSKPAVTMPLAEFIARDADGKPSAPVAPERKPKP